MSLFNRYKTIIEEGDLVLVFISRDNIKPITVNKDAVLNTRYGSFAHNDMIDSKFGAQIASSKGYGFVHLLHPTPELWTLSLPHRTQIVYTPDSSYIQQRLGVTSGSRVIEAGTGSGSFSHSFVRTCGEAGKVFSYEFHGPRYEEAKSEFELHKLQNIVITHRDVCKDGFEIADINEAYDVDSIFLDLPSPWEAISHLDPVISRTRRVGICCFSPCIEQVFKTIEALKTNGWISIETVEVAGRKFEARKEMLKDIDDVLKRLKDIKRRKQEGIQNQKDGKIAKKVEKEEPFGKGKRVKEGDENYKWLKVTKVDSEIKTHTSYLTFAYKMPSPSV